MPRTTTTPVAMRGATVRGRGIDLGTADDVATGVDDGARGFRRWQQAWQ
jgi:hypothetical protein